MAIAIATSATSALMTSAAFAQASGPLRVHPTNPRYFADGQGRAVYLTGSHTWSSLQDSWTGSFVAFDFNAYLDMLQANGHNFIRLWRLELPEAKYGSDPTEYHSPHPWKRTGPGAAGDGGLKFNLTQFDQAYFDRLRARCIAAGQRGMYVGIMLFEGHALTNTSAGWYSHPFKLSNNVNNVNGDPDSDGVGDETHSLEVSSVTSAQQAYVRKVIDTVNDLDNIFYEISNESPESSIAWQNQMIAYIKQYQATKPQQHLVWMTTTFPNSTGNSELWNSSAEVISPGMSPSGGAYRDNPPVNSGGKVIINDTDHLWGCGGNDAWVWKTFMRGMHPIYMDGYYSNGGACDPNMGIRRQLGYTRRFADRMNLANVVPSTTIASSGWCLADAGDAYLAYAPSGGNITINLSGASGAFDVEWFNPGNGQSYAANDVTGGGNRTLSPPFSGQAVLFVFKPSPGGVVGDINGDGLVNSDDLVAVISQWGSCAGCPADVNDNGVVNTDDLMVVLGNWG